MTEQRCTIFVVVKFQSINQRLFKSCGTKKLPRLKHVKRTEIQLRVMLTYEATCMFGFCLRSHRSYTTGHEPRVSSVNY